MSLLWSLPKRLLVGTPLHSSRMGETLLPKKLALPVFCSDPLSSNAYATEEILLMLSLGGLSLLHLTPWIAGAVVVLLVIVVLSYRQTCHAYPNGGGAYAVSRENLGRRAALVLPIRGMDPISSEDHTSGTDTVRPRASAPKGKCRQKSHTFAAASGDVGDAVS